jgi:hypothetical protein
MWQEQEGASRIKSPASLSASGVKTIPRLSEFLVKTFISLSFVGKPLYKNP